MSDSNPGAGALDIVALDGPGGVGKSSVAREVAARLGWRVALDAPAQVSIRLR